METRKAKTSTVLVMFATYLLLLRVIRLRKQTSYAKTNKREKPKTPVS